MRENSVPMPLLVTATLAGNLHRRICDWRRHPGVEIRRSKPIALFAAQKRHTRSQKRRQLYAGAKVLRSLQRVEPARAQKVNVADSPESVDARRLMLRVPVGQRLARVRNYPTIIDDDGLRTRIFILE